MNGATCVNLQGSYRCDCKSGYSGNNCDTGDNNLIVSWNYFRRNKLNVFIKKNTIIFFQSYVAVYFFLSTYEQHIAIDLVFADQFRVLIKTLSGC